MDVHITKRDDMHTEKPNIQICVAVIAKCVVRWVRMEPHTELGHVGYRMGVEPTDQKWGTQDTNLRM